LSKDEANEVLRQSALEQAIILVAYLSKTRADAVDLDFVTQHAEALVSFAQQAKKAGGGQEGE